MARPHFRFEDLDVWKDASELAAVFHEVAAQLEERRLYRYAEQLRGAGLSPSNNIAEGSASHHDKEFIQFLNIARRSTAELASMALSFEKMQLIDQPETDRLLEQADKVARKLTAFIRHLGSKQ